MASPFPVLPSSFSRIATRAFQLLLFWSIPAFLIALQFVADNRMQERRVPFLLLVLHNLPRWLLWAALTPLVIALVRQVPIGPRRRARGLLIHGAAAAFCGLLFNVVWVAQFFLVPENAQYRPATIFWVMMPVSVLWTAGIYTTIVSLACALASERQRSDLERQLAETHLEMLRHQLQPHFFFNTLHAVSGLIRLNHNREAIAMIARLGEWMREALTEPNQQETTLRRELELLDLYLEIQRIRFPDRLEVRKNVSPDTLGARLPVMLLQPLAENAFDHGIAPRPEGGWIELRSERSGDQLEVTIRNSGAPLDERRRVGIGLRNTMERLRTLYGERARFELASETDGIVAARIRLPWVAAGNA